MTAITATSAKPSPQRLALAALVLGGFTIGCSPILVRLSEVGPLATGFWRVALALLPLMAWSGATSSSRAQATRPASLSECLALIVPGVMLAGDLVAWHLSLHMTSVANATLFTNMAPIFVTLGSWLLFRTPITRVFLIGLALSMVGVVVLKGGDGPSADGDLAGDATALVASIFYAGYLLSLARLRTRFSTLTAMLWTTVSAGICLLPIALFMESSFIPLTFYGWAILLGLGWFTHASGQGLIIYALAWLPPAFSSLTLLIQPVVAAVLAWILLSEPLGAAQALGGIVVLAGIFVARRG